jgi:hypothetical protein
MSTKISDKVRDFAEEWDGAVSRFEEYYENAREASLRADDALDTLKALQNQCTALGGELGSGQLQPVADAELDGITVSEPEWVDPLCELPRLWLAYDKIKDDEAGDDEAEDDEAEDDEPV